MTDAPQRPARSRSERRTARDESRSAPSWTSDRSILTMSKRNWLSSRRPALPAPTSSAAMRSPARCSAIRFACRRVDVLDRLALGQLDDDALGRDAVASQDG